MSKLTEFMQGIYFDTIDSAKESRGDRGSSASIKVEKAGWSRVEDAWWWKNAMKKARLGGFGSKVVEWS